MLTSIQDLCFSGGRDCRFLPSQRGKREIDLLKRDTPKAVYCSIHAVYQYIHWISIYLHQSIFLLFCQLCYKCRKQLTEWLVGSFLLTLTHMHIRTKASTKIHPITCLNWCLLENTAGPSKHALQESRPVSFPKPLHTELWTESIPTSIYNTPVT